MHKLDRTACAPPTCLAGFVPGRDNWDRLTHLNREEIRGCLEIMQGRRCAYCEGSLDQLGQHIDHFRQKGRFPQFTFVWANLLWSCYQDDHCGRFKDQIDGGYDPADLLDPTIDDPEKFLRFYSDGSIRPRDALTPTDERRATETLRVLNIAARWGALRQRRAAAVRQYRDTNPDYLAELQTLSPEECKEFLTYEIENTSAVPFATAIKHFLESLI